MNKLNDLDRLLGLRDKIVSTEVKIKIKQNFLNNPFNSSDKIDIEKVTAEKLDLEEKLKILETELDNLKSIIEAKSQKLKKIHRTIIEGFYLNNYNLNEVSIIYDYDYDYVRHNHIPAREKFLKIAQHSTPTL